MLDRGPPPVSLAQLTVPAVEKFCKLYESQELALVSRALRQHEQRNHRGQVSPPGLGQYQCVPPVKGPQAPPVESGKQQQSIGAATSTQQARTQVQAEQVPSSAQRTVGDPVPAAATMQLSMQDSDQPDQDLLWLQLPTNSIATSCQCSSEGAIHAQLLQSAAAAGSPAVAAVQGARQCVQQHAGQVQGRDPSHTAAAVQQQHQQQQQLEVQVAAAFQQQFAALPAADASRALVHPEVIKLFVASAASASLQSRVSS